MDEKTMNRVARWTQKLLDLSLRNRLLNARDSKQLLPLSVDSVSSLEDRLYAGHAVPVFPSDAAKAPSDALKSTLSAEETRRRLKELYRVAKTGLEESGVNALYLAMGFLRWRPGGSGAKDYSAPILLMPVRLSRRSMSEGYSLSRLDEDTSLNTTLVEFLRSEFGITVEGVDPLPEDASGVDVDAVMSSFGAAIGGQDGWAVEASAGLGYFSFGKFVMWKDLSTRSAQLAAHPLVAHLMKGGGDYDDGVEVFPPEEVAAHAKYGEVFTPLSSDSSQLAAVLYSAMGKSFVLHGPPGTGKSQTITNMIAHNLACGRKVLFVSEKKAALDVVHRRLASVGLGPFCLELHSNKSGKADVLAQFAEALDYVDKGLPNEWGPTVGQIEACRARLDAPVAALHRRQRNGLSAYDCFADRIVSAPAVFRLSGARFSDRSEEDVSVARESVMQAAADWRGTTPEAVRALDAVSSFAWNPAAEEQMRGKLASLRARGSLSRGLSVLFGGGGVLRFKGGFADRFAGFGADFVQKLDAAIAYMGESRGVMRYRASADSAVKLVGGGFVAALEKGAFDPAMAGEAFDRALAETTLNEILSGEPALASFAGLNHEEQVLEFRRLDAEYSELVKHTVRARLAASLPLGRLGECPDGCELGIIRRECAKKARHKPVRQLLAEARGMVGRLKPCFLMSPLSVAQYLPAEATFDMVVFDEASQIPVWDAVGVIARAKQCVVVGDPKQMPPTNFFQKGDTGSDEDSDAEDLESILDECLAAGLHAAYLSWHYRSRHESLIAFSNKNYYDGRLYTFPAARPSPQLGVAFHYVEDGVYDAKASRTNRAEAEALVDYVFSRLAEPGWKRRSAGVVTFSMAQKSLVEDLFEERRAADQRYEDFFSDDADEPFFVKNLENVQGDERDVILFSVGYAKGPDGKFMMNFGPLNRSGGERRLNVAVTRAKEQVVVFASCRGTEIDLSRTQATGAAHLKAFLDYAERGGIAVGGEAEERRDRFVDEVAGFLTARGYALERNVGTSGCRIDIGVLDPTRKGSFMAAVECDGDTYASALTTRDRDELRASVLRSLGWNTVRVWAADWAFDRKRGEERLLKELEEIGHAKDGLLPVPGFATTVTFPRRRPQSAAESPRIQLDAVPNEKIREVMAAVERDIGSCEPDTLYRETARRFGYKTLSPKARERLECIRRR